MDAQSLPLPPQDSQVIRTDIPVRLDALPWSRWHTFIVIALGITWVLDGLEVTLAGAVGSALTDPRTLGLTAAQIGLAGTWYLVGAVLGAIFFGWATDRFGRRKLFFLTLILYVSATGATAFSWSASSFYFFRALTGAGIGGEYAAINSAIDELIPARVRGQVDLIINSTFWLGAALGSGATIFLLDPARFPIGLGWRLAFGVGAALGLIILFLREAVPESPRWLMIHGRKKEADKIIEDVEASVMHHHAPPKHEDRFTEIRRRPGSFWQDITHTMLVRHRTRSLLSLTLMVAQAFFYNAAGFFTLALVLSHFYSVPPSTVSFYLLPFAVGNILGPLTLGRLFDAIGRKTMITATYALSGLMLALTGYLFAQNLLTAKMLVAAWTAIFFVASCAASSAYLTVSEIFPLELRAMAIAIFFAIGTLVGGAAAPAIFGQLIHSGSREHLFWGFLGAAGLMLLAAVCEAVFGVRAERKSLEEIAAPLATSPRTEQRKAA